MNEFLSKLAKLINVKSIITILMTVVFMVLSLNGTLTGDQFISIFTVVVAFYFGTQAEKIANGNKDNEDKTE